MDIKTKLKMALAHAGMSQAQLAREMGQTPSNISQKIKRETLTQAELEQAAFILGGKWVARFEFDDGTII